MAVDEAGKQDVALEVEQTSAPSGSSALGPIFSITPSRANSPASFSSRRCLSMVTSMSAFFASSVAIGFPCKSP